MPSDDRLMWYSIGIWRPYGNSYSTFSCCNSYKVYHYDHSTSDHERFQCLILQTCVFQLNYIHETRKPDIKEQIVEMVHNGVGVRDSSRTLKVDNQHRHSHFIKRSPRKVQPHLQSPVPM